MFEMVPFQGEAFLQKIRSEMDEMLNRLPAQVDRAKLQAKCKDGIPCFALPKGAKVAITKIEVASGLGFAL